MGIVEMPSMAEPILAPCVNTSLMRPVFVEAERQHRPAVVHEHRRDAAGDGKALPAHGALPRSDPARGRAASRHP